MTPEHDKGYIGKYAEVISQVMMKTSDGSTVIIDLENIGTIEILPWASEHEPGDIFGAAEDRAVFNPVNGNDVLILELMAEHARKLYEMARTEEEAQQADKPEAKSPRIVTGETATEGLNRFVLK